MAVPHLPLMCKLKICKACEPLSSKRKVIISSFHSYVATTWIYCDAK